EHGREPIDPLTWRELLYPEEHPWAGNSIDLAFEIYGTPGGPCDCIPGDANGDGMVNVGDAVYIINNIFKDGPSPDPICAGYANTDGALNVGDAVYLINYIFREGAPPQLGCVE
ncbi:MAG: dockerin type I repeat-containing protein, partial [Woeseiaceae bacterium]